MRALVVHEAGGPGVLRLEEWPEPTPRPGWVTIAVQAFGLNRAEAVTRAGGSGDAVLFPRIIGIEAVGIVLDGGETDLAPGATVATAMGGLGRQHDGSYAEVTQARREFVFPITVPSQPDGSPLPWATVGALPETFFTAIGCLRVAGVLHPAQPESITAADPNETPRVVVRPGASALGAAIAQIVGDLGGETIAVTRSASKVDTLRARGMTEVLVTSTDRPATVADAVRARWPHGATAVVDTVASTATVTDDIACLATAGRITIAGSLAASYDTDSTDGLGELLARPDIAFFSSEDIRTDVETHLLAAVLQGVAQGRFDPGIDAVVGLDDVAEAHRNMEANAYAGKVVVDLSR